MAIKKLKTVAVDFDGTIAKWEHNFPVIGEPIKGAKDFLIELKRRGYLVILHSCRFTKKLNGELAAREQLFKVDEWLDDHGMSNLVDDFWNEEGKPVADAYVDDRAVQVNESDDWPAALERITYLVEEY